MPKSICYSQLLTGKYYLRNSQLSLFLRLQTTLGKDNYSLYYLNSCFEYFKAFKHVSTFPYFHIFFALIFPISCTAPIPKILKRNTGYAIAQADHSLCIFCLDSNMTFFCVFNQNISRSFCSHEGSCIIPGWSAPRQVIHDKYEINDTCEKNPSHNFRGEDV